MLPAAVIHTTKATKKVGSASKAGVQNTKLHTTTDSHFRSEADARGVANTLQRKKTQKLPNYDVDIDGEQESIFREQTLRKTRNRLAAISNAAKKKMLRRGLAASTRWMGISIAGYISLWIFVFSMLTLGSFAGEVTTSVLVDSATGAVVGGVTGSETAGEIAGAVVSNVVTLFGLIDLSWAFPGETLGMAFWVLAAIFAAVGYLGFGLWYKIIGVPFFDSTIGGILIAFMIACDFLPFTNWFPWLVVWVVYMNMRSYFHVRG
jgi:hypothetical protein